MKTTKGTYRGLNWAVCKRDSFWNYRTVRNNAGQRESGYWTMYVQASDRLSIDRLEELSKMEVTYSRDSFPIDAFPEEWGLRVYGWDTDHPYGPAMTGVQAIAFVQNVIDGILRDEGIDEEE